MYNKFIFERYDYDDKTGLASFRYNFDNQRYFVETVTFEVSHDYDTDVLDKALRLAFLIAGVSYYKCFPTREVQFVDLELSASEADLMSHVYRDGLSQFMFENELNPENIAHFDSGNRQDIPVHYSGSGVSLLQSGGKDSLLMAEILRENKVGFSGIYISSTDEYPEVLNDVGAKKLRIIKRLIDNDGLHQASVDGSLNGHVPVTYITCAYGLIDAVLHGDNTVLASIGREGGEAHAWIGSLAVNHQWSKTWEAEQLLANYVRVAISSDIRIGSPLRSFSELRIAELFAQKAWNYFGRRFSSCNIANYKQGHDSSKLGWCGECPKCANSFLLFAPFIEPNELMEIFGGKNLFKSEQLAVTFKGLLGIDGVMKPFECIGEVTELRQAYHMARTRYPGLYDLPFEVPSQDDFDYLLEGDCQDWARAYATT